MPLHPMRAVLRAGRVQEWGGGHQAGWRRCQGKEALTDGRAGIHTGSGRSLLAAPPRGQPLLPGQREDRWASLPGQPPPSGARRVGEPCIPVTSHAGTRDHRTNGPKWIPTFPPLLGLPNPRNHRRGNSWWQGLQPGPISRQIL